MVDGAEDLVLVGRDEAAGVVEKFGVRPDQVVDVGHLGVRERVVALEPRQVDDVLHEERW